MLLIQLFVLHKDQLQNKNIKFQNHFQYKKREDLKYIDNYLM